MQKEECWGWVVCSNTLVLFLVYCGFHLAWAEIIPYMYQDFKLSLTTYEIIGFVPLGVTFLLGPLATLAYNKLGARTVVIAGVLITAAVTCAVAAVSNIWLIILFYSVLGGLGCGLVWTPPFYLVALYFPRHHPRHVFATSLMVCGLPLGNLAFNPLTYELLELTNWHQVFLVYGILILVVGLGAGLTFKEPTEAVENASSDESGEDWKTQLFDSCDDNLDESKTKLSDWGQHMYGSTDFEKKDSMLLHDEEEKTASVGKKKLVICTLWFAASLLKCTAYFAPYMTLVQVMIGDGIPQERASKIMTGLAVAELISRLITSFIGDYFKGSILHVYSGLTCALGAICFIAAWLAHTYIHWLLFTIGMGVFGGPIIAALFSACGEMLDGKEVQVLYSLVTVGLGTGLIIGPVMFGAMYDLTGSFSPAFYLNGALFILTTLLYVVIIILDKR